MTEIYEELRDSAIGEAGEAWRQADREEANLRVDGSGYAYDGERLRDYAREGS